MTQWDEIEVDGEIHASGVTVIKPDGFMLKVSRAFDDQTPRKRVLFDCHCGLHGYQFYMTADKAEALARLLLHAANSLREQPPVGEGEH